MYVMHVILFQIFLLQFSLTETLQGVSARIHPTPGNGDTPNIQWAT